MSMPSWSQAEFAIEAELEDIPLLIPLAQYGKASWLRMIHQEADAFFHHQQRPLPSPAPPTFTQTQTPSAPIIQQSDDQQLRLSNMLKNSSLVDKAGSSTSVVPWHRKTDQSSPEAYLDAVLSTSATPMPQDKPSHTEQIEEQEDIEMESADYSSTLASKSTTTNTKKGLAASIWNPANINARTDSVGSDWSFETSSDTNKTTPAPIVTSGITKGPGLKASRWYQEF
ncbi:hypothetical protein F5Y09DRAFT_338117 [Xylaria sp. FL1042]|nr:hypothetical protein F5Y09DRAFT_338117 [Xylaria sp. FL1042]